VSICFDPHCEQRSRSLTRAVQLSCENLDSALQCRSLNTRQQWGVFRKIRTRENRNTSDAWKRVHQQLKAFSAKLNFNVGHTRVIASRAREAFDNSKPHWVRHESEHDRSLQPGALQRHHGRRGQRYD
jgi:hypothetical protein